MGAPTVAQKGIRTMPRRKLLATPLMALRQEGSFDCVAPRCAHGNFAPDDSAEKCSGLSATVRSVYALT